MDFINFETAEKICPPEFQEYSGVVHGDAYFEHTLNQYLFRPENAEFMHVRLLTKKGWERVIVHRIFKRHGYPRALVEFDDQTTTWIYDWESAVYGIPLIDLPTGRERIQAFLSKNQDLWHKHCCAFSRKIEDANPSDVLLERTNVVFHLKILVPKKYYRPFWID